MGGGSWDADAVLTILLLGQMEDGNEGRGGEGREWGGSCACRVGPVPAVQDPVWPPWLIRG